MDINLISRESKYENISCNKGFTILEVIVVLSLLAVLVSVASVTMAPLKRWHLQAAAHEMAGYLRSARQDAIACGQPSEVVFFIYGDCYSLRLNDEVRCIELPDGIEFKGTTTFSGTPPLVYFNYMGRPSGGGTVTLQSGNDEKRYVIMTPVTGRVRVSREPPDYWL